MTRHGRFGKTLGSREARRAVTREARIHRPTAEALHALAFGKDVPTSLRVTARLWLRFPGTRQSNVLARVNGLHRRRAANRVARTSRKTNRRR